MCIRHSAFASYSYGLVYGSFISLDWYSLNPTFITVRFLLKLGAFPQFYSTQGHWILHIGQLTSLKQGSFKHYAVEAANLWVALRGFEVGQRPYCLVPYRYNLYQRFLNTQNVFYPWFLRKAFSTILFSFKRRTIVLYLMTIILYSMTRFFKTDYWRIQTNSGSISSFLTDSSPSSLLVFWSLFNFRTRRDWNKFTIILRWFFRTPCNCCWWRCFLQHPVGPSIISTGFTQLDVSKGDFISSLPARWRCAARRGPGARRSGSSQSQRSLDLIQTN